VKNKLDEYMKRCRSRLDLNEDGEAL
jgi:hypothetical protein